MISPRIVGFLNKSNIFRINVTCLLQMTIIVVLLITIINLINLRCVRKRIYHVYCTLHGIIRRNTMYYCLSGFFLPGSEMDVIRSPCCLFLCVHPPFTLFNHLADFNEYSYEQCANRWSQWPCGLRRRSSAARLLRSWVRIPPKAWMFVL